MKFYHYTTEERADSMETGFYYQRTGLLPVHPFISKLDREPFKLPRAADEKVTHGLLNPFDPAWCRKKLDKGTCVLEDMLNDIFREDECRPFRHCENICLLEVTPQDDARIYVADYSWCMTFDHIKRNVDDGRDSMLFMKAYVEKITPLQEYLSGALSYVLPEVICLDPIPYAGLKRLKTYTKENLLDHVHWHSRFLKRPSQEEKADMQEEVAMPQRSFNTKLSKLPSYISLVKN